MVSELSACLLRTLLPLVKGVSAVLRISMISSRYLVHLKVMEGTPESQQDLIKGLRYLVRVSEVPDTDFFGSLGICLSLVFTMLDLCSGEGN